MISPQARSRQDSSDKSQTSCDLIRQALEEASRIKSGMTRREVEKHFKPDGGLQARQETRYLYSKCNYIRIDIDFKVEPPSDRTESSPYDIVVKVLTPYLDNPTAD
jgi:hypothetical protein